ncbi:hypothetical protein CH373_11635 [Leptospira perolatii]|uniref:Lipoprotein n=1 Tax=Leptospira perolatii TaxID=2023191 RepID=A0A2M9ZMB4_9LEPT|nr:hypothetical protein [Leptospira perolatii]PJZ69117.1 hypothetical protein CH360_12630 [Leptospira perolatii]PJZ73139.1 hypothetical protein CH373_11635 [Leptospira perolatii]
MKSQMIRFGSMLIFFSLFFASCQHARLKLAPVQEKTKVADAKENPPEINIKQRYYLFGLYPRNMEYSEKELCPARGIKEIHQYSTFWDLTFEQLTIGIYSPRSLSIQCYGSSKTKGKNI